MSNFENSYLELKYFLSIQIFFKILEKLQHECFIHETLHQ
jgi:hypothetical protein